MASPGQLRPAREPGLPATLVVADRPDPELSRFFYRLVGGPWLWVDRLGWTPDQWLAWVDRPEHQLISCWCPPPPGPSPGAPGVEPPPGREPEPGWVPAGYVELEQQGTAVEVVYFGLAEAFIGQGLGGWLLTEGLRRAWAVPGTERVWLHTCSLDGPNALANYRARGLEVTGETIEWRLV